MKEQLEHKDRVAFITGGARGFGKAFAIALTGQGARVVLADIDGEAAAVTAAELNATGATALAVSCDVANEESVNAAVQQAVEEFGGIDILINNAGLHSQAYNEPMTTSGVAKLRQLFDVNVMGVIICSLAAREAMAGRNGVIINISSSASYGCQTAYGASKLAVRGLTITLANDLKGDGIRVNAIAPGLIFTDTIRAELSPDVVNYVKQQQILDQEGEEQDIVNALLFLVSPKSSFITGETLRVSGGFTLGIG